MNVLVTGAAGFIGSHKAEKLASLGFNVTGVDNLANYYSKQLKLLNVASLKENGVEFIEMDLRYIDQYKKLLSRFDYIFHFAAQPGLSATSTFNDYLSNNATATHELAGFAKKNNNLRLFVNISTSSVYGLDATKDETAVPMPASYYGVTKLVAEQIVLAESRNKSFNACSLRLYSVYGPRERPDKLYTKLIKAALEDKPFTLIEGSLQHKRSFTYVGDIIDGILKVIDKEETVNNEIFNIGTNVQHTTADGIETVEDLTGKKIQFTMLPPRGGDQLSTKAIIDKARKMLNYDPQTSLHEGILQQINWFEKYQEVFEKV
ncbi:MAG TPA: NAD-dependent epimerase/dehydratase family protein [Parafilimonas sp.]|nr:NAD-dependent epimerase/dehydratase family protein [Parafilimonas sp.]